MIRKPYIFETRTELIQKLQSNQTQKSADNFFNARIPSIELVVRQAVEGNTFRAFRKLPEKPSVVFREWTTKHINNTLDELEKISNSEEYSAYIDKTTEALCYRWQTAMKASEIGYGRGSKLLNLVFKKLACYSDLDEVSRKRLIELQHVPLDSYTILGLRQLINTPPIPSNATMKFIENPKDYNLMQQFISSVAKEAGVPAIYYDILAWDSAHA